MKPLFIPLKTEFFEAFENGTKDTEYRCYSDRWNEHTCKEMDENKRCEIERLSAEANDKLVRHESLGMMNMQSHTFNYGAKNDHIP